MQSSWWVNLLCGLEVPALICVLASFWNKSLVARWPALFTSLALELAADLMLGFLMYMHFPYATYFYVFWITSGIQSVVRLWIIGDIMRSFPGIDFLPGYVYQFVGIAGAVMAAASAIYCYHASPSLGEELMGAVLILNRCICVAWLSFAVVVLASIKLINLGWSPNGARLGSGVFLRICAGAIASDLLAQSSLGLRMAADGFQSVCSIAVFISWIYYIHHNHQNHAEGCVVQLVAENHFGLLLGDRGAGKDEWI